MSKVTLITNTLSKESNNTFWHNTDTTLGRIGRISNMTIQTIKRASIKGRNVDYDELSPENDIINDGQVVFVFADGTTQDYVPAKVMGNMYLSIPENVSTVRVIMTGTNRSSVPEKGIFYTASVKTLDISIMPNENVGKITFATSGTVETEYTMSTQIAGPIRLSSGEYLISHLGQTGGGIEYGYDRFVEGSNSFVTRRSSTPEETLLIEEYSDQDIKIIIGERTDVWSQGAIYASIVEPTVDSRTATTTVKKIRSAVSRTGYKQPTGTDISSHAKRINSKAIRSIVTSKRSTPSRMKKIASKAMTGVSRPMVFINAVTHLDSIYSSVNVGASISKKTSSSVKRINTSSIGTFKIGKDAMTMLKEQLGIAPEDTNKDNELQLLLDEAYQFIHETCFQVHNPMPLSGIIIAVKYALHSYYGDNHPLNPSFYDLESTYSSKRSKRRILKRELYLAGLVLKNRIIGDSQKDVIVIWE